MTQPSRRPRRLFARSESRTEVRYLADALRTETVGGLLLLVATATALVWANSPAGDSYQSLRETVVGPASLHLDLSLQTWAADGLLAVFFFVVGLELKREVVVGDLRNPARAAVPIAAAVGGMAVPALIFLAVTVPAGGDASHGWAIPTATDIAFAVAVLAVIGSHLPSGLRAFLLTLAVVDDLLAITIIAVFYTDTISFIPLAAALVVIAAFAVLTRRRVTAWWVLVPLGVLAWALMHESGIHATIAGVLLGFVVPARPGPGEPNSAAEVFDHRVRPLSAGFAVPVFAFFAAGVALGEAGGIAGVLDDPVAVGIIAGLVLGKPIGVFGTTWLVATVTRAQLDAELSWSDLLGVALLAGVGFTVSLLIGELAFGPASTRDEHVRAAVLAGSVFSALLASIVLVRRNRVYRRLADAEELSLDEPSGSR